MANLPEPQTPGFPGVYQIELDDDVVGGPGGISNRQAENLVERTKYLKDALEAEVAERETEAEGIQDQVTQNTDDIAANAANIASMKGRGGYLQAHDFGTHTPTQQQLFDYALSQVKAGASEEDIWNGTHVKNLYKDPVTEIIDNHVWVLTNTPDTNPPILEWTDDGFDSLSFAGDNVAGAVTGSEATEEGGVRVNPITGKMSIILPTGLESASAQPFIARTKRFLNASAKRVLTLKKKTYIPLEISGVDRYLKAESDLVLNVESLLDTGVSLVAGKDYKVFLVKEGAGTAIVVSQNSDAPSGVDPSDCIAIGGFHTLCVDAGTGMTYSFGGGSFDHPLNGYVAGDILPASVWCLGHRPYSLADGMVFIDLLNFWCDIYLQSGSGATTKSAYQGTITRNRQIGDFVEDLFCVKKELLYGTEFAAAMLGSNEQTAVSGASESAATTNGAGGRKDTANRRMISAFGVEEGCGNLWQFLNPEMTGGANTSSAAAQSGGKGAFWYGNVLLAGGNWGSGTSCGSRCRNANDARSNSHANVGGRGRSLPMIV